MSYFKCDILSDFQTIWKIIISTFAGFRLFKVQTEVESETMPADDDNQVH